MEIKYFVSYSHPEGFGCSKVIRKNPICEWGDVDSLKNDLETALELTGVVILYWTRFEENKNNQTNDTTNP